MLLNTTTISVNSVGNNSTDLYLHDLEMADFVLDLLTFMLAILTNFSLLTIEGKLWFQRKRLSQPKVLIIFLASMDSFSAVFSLLPKMILYQQTCVSRMNLGVFEMVRFCSECSMNASKLTVVLMGVERCISIQAPFFYVRKCTIRHFCIAETTLVFYAIVKSSCSLLVDLYFLEKTLHQSESANTRNCSCLFLKFEYMLHLHRTSSLWSYYSALSILKITEDFILVFGLVLCNIAVMIGIHTMEKRRRITCPRPRGQYANEMDYMAAKGKEFSRLMIVIIIIFILLHTPSIMRSAFNQFCVFESLTADFVCKRIALTSLFTNPFLYGLLRRKIRSRVSHNVLRMLKCCRPTSVAPMEAIESDSQTCIRHVTFSQNKQTTTIRLAWDAATLNAAIENQNKPSGSRQHI